MGKIATKGNEGGMAPAVTEEVNQNNRKALTWGLQTGTFFVGEPAIPMPAHQSSQPTRMMGGWKVRKILDTTTAGKAAESRHGKQAAGG